MDSYDLKNVQSSSTTEIREETFAYRWDIKNFKTVAGLESVSSSEFQGGMDSGHFWKLTVNPRRRIENTDYLSINLKLVKFGKGWKDNKVYSRFQVTILDREDKPRMKLGDGKMDIWKFYESTELGWKKFMKTSQLMSYYLVDDTLKVHCRLWIVHVDTTGGELEGEAIHSEETTILRGKEILSSDLKSLYASTFGSDVVIISKGRLFKAHKIILSARSSVFAAMFRNGILQSFSNSIEIKDFEDEIVQGMLEYIYSGEVERINETSSDLIRIAERYDVRGLKEECLIRSGMDMTVENVAEILLMADRCNVTQLKAKAIEFINANKDAVKNTQTFQQLIIAAPALLMDLYISS